jgi:hypothetical protein
MTDLIKNKNLNRTKNQVKNKLIILLFIAVLIHGCSSKKDDPAPLVLDPTTLELTVLNGTGNIVSGATVQLFSNENDWKNGTNQIGSDQISDANGKVKFTNLATIKYYFWGYKGCSNNYNGGVALVNPLTANVKNTVNLVITETSTLKFVNNSNNPYRIYINGTTKFDMDGNTNRTVFNLPTGDYTLRYLQLSGYLVSATDETLSTTLNCNEITTLTYPF